MGHLVAIDLETSGLDPQVHEIIEVGLVFETMYPDPLVPEPRITEMAFSVPFDLDKADRKALEINGYLNGRKFAEPWSKLEAASYLSLKLLDAHLLGKNPGSFDSRFLESFFRRNGYDVPKWHHRMVDVGSVAMGRFHCRTPMSTDDIEKATGIKVKDRHSALGDAKWAWDVFEYLTK